MKDNSQRRSIPKEKLFVVKNNKMKIDFAQKFTYIYFDWWFELLVLPCFLFCYVLATLSALYFGLTVSGRENLRILKKKGCVVISNHCHYFDTVFASYTFFPRHLYTSVAQRNFEVPIVRRILRLLRAFPIPNHSLGFKMIANSVGEALRRRHSILVLPEGDLCYMSQEIFKFKPGAFYMSYMHQAPILPMVYVLTKREKNGVEKKHRPRIRQVFGEPICPPPLRPDGAFPKEELDAMMEKAARWMEGTLAAYHKDEVAPSLSTNTVSDTAMPAQ
ncbi:MAG: lysophospholipid acyltransferase family protein [Spirochaetota bacterium]